MKSIIAHPKFGDQFSQSTYTLIENIINPEYKSRAFSYFKDIKILIEIKNKYNKETNNLLASNWTNFMLLVEDQINFLRSTIDSLITFDIEEIKSNN